MSQRAGSSKRSPRLWVNLRLPHPSKSSSVVTLSATEGGRPGRTGHPDPGECTGTSESDFIAGTGGSDNINAKAGSDEVFGNGGEDVIHGRRGNDRLEGGAQNDVLFGDFGSDYLTGRGGSNQYFGGTGPDTIFADEFDFTADNSVEIVSGGPGDDLIVADDTIPHQDVIHCGRGFDLVNAGSEDEVNLDNLGLSAEVPGETVWKFSGVLTSEGEAGAY